MAPLPAMLHVLRAPAAPRRPFDVFEHMFDN
jgi:hypothetical protein